MSADRSTQMLGEIEMKHLLRPFHTSYLNPAFAGLAARRCLSASNVVPRRQPRRGSLRPYLEDTSPLLAHTSVPGYLGVDVTDVDADKAQAPQAQRCPRRSHHPHRSRCACRPDRAQSQRCRSRHQWPERRRSPTRLRRMLRDIPPGRKISLEISRDGNIQTMGVQLVDRKAMEHDIWTRLDIGRRWNCARRTAGCHGPHRF